MTTLATLLTLLKHSRTRRTTLATAAISFGLLAYTPVKEAFNADPLLALKPVKGQRITDRDGQLYLELPENDIPANTGPKELRKHLKNAVIAREDSRFMSHWGIDPIGFCRAMLANLTHLRFKEGASTVTMQLVDLTYDYPEETKLQRIQSKLFEYVMAVRVEWNARSMEGVKGKKDAKHLIMVRYLDRIDFGTYVGIKEAADRTFGKTLAELNLGESAYLAGLFRAPSRNSVRRNPDNACKARDAVVQNMVKQGFITSPQARGAKFYALKEPKQSRRGDGFTAQQVRKEINALTEQGLVPEHLWSNADLEIQIYSNVQFQTDLTQSLEAQLKRIEAMPGFISPHSGKPLNGAAIVIEHSTGGVFSMVGGRDFDAEQMNLCIMGQRPSASAIKPFVYAAYMTANHCGISSTLSNAPLLRSEAPGFGGLLSPKEHMPLGNYSLWNGLSSSSNTMAMRAGVRTPAHFLKHVFHGLHLTTKELPKNTGLFLGNLDVHPINLAAAYAAIENEGRYTQPRLIKCIRVNGKAVYTHKPNPEAVLDPKVCTDLTRAMRETLTQGTAAAFGGKELAMQLPLAGKSGTNTASTDAWFCGYSSHFTIVIWIGFPEGQRQIIPGGSGSSLAFPVWKAAFHDLKKRGYRFDSLPSLAPSHPTLVKSPAPKGKAKPTVAQVIKLTATNKGSSQSKPSPSTRIAKAEPRKRTSQSIPRPVNQPSKKPTSSTTIVQTTPTRKQSPWPAPRPEILEATAPPRALPVEDTPKAQTLRPVQSARLNPPIGTGPIAPAHRYRPPTISQLDR